jgi:carnitine 3-dehydrogenase / betainyl-CoA thioesterase
VQTQVLGADEKRLHLFHTMCQSVAGTVLATGEHMLLHVATSAGKVCQILEPVKSRIQDAASAHAGLPVPDGAGRAIALRR